MDQLAESLGKLIWSPHFWHQNKYTRWYNLFWYSSEKDFLNNFWNQEQNVRRTRKQRPINSARQKFTPIGKIKPLLELFHDPVPLTDTLHAIFFTLKSSFLKKCLHWLSLHHSFLPESFLSYCSPHHCTETRLLLTSQVAAYSKASVRFSAYLADY